MHRGGSVFHSACDESTETNCVSPRSFHESQEKTREKKGMGWSHAAVQAGSSAETSQEEALIISIVSAFILNQIFTR